MTTMILFILGAAAVIAALLMEWGGHLVDETKPVAQEAVEAKDHLIEKSSHLERMSAIETTNAVLTGAIEDLGKAASANKNAFQDLEKKLEHLVKELNKVHAHDLGVSEDLKHKYEALDMEMVGLKAKVLSQPYKMIQPIQIEVIKKPLPRAVKKK